MSAPDYYLVHIHKDSVGKRVMLEDFPELDVLHVAHVNNICPVHYGEKEGPCVDDGTASVELCVNGRHRVRLDARDSQRNHVVVIGEYEFMGDGVLTYQRSRDRTYLVFKVHHYVGNGGNHSGKWGTETRTYRAGDIFMLEVTESGGTGHTWHLTLPASGLILLQETYLPHCEESDTDDQGPHCVNTHRFVLKAEQKGHFFIDAVYSRLWEEYGTQQKDGGRKTRQYEVIVV